MAERYKPRRFRMEYGSKPYKGYIVRDYGSPGDPVVFTSHNKSDTEQKADKLNAEANEGSK